MPAFLTDLVTKLEAVDFAHATDRQAVGVGAAGRRRRGRHDLSRIVIARRFIVGVVDDVLRQPMRTLFRVLLADIAANSPQLDFLVMDPSPL